MQLKYVKPVKNMTVREVKLLLLNTEFEFIAWLTDAWLTDIAINAWQTKVQCNHFRNSFTED